MIRVAVTTDIPAMVGMFREHHSEKRFAFPFNAARISTSLATAISSPASLALVAERGLLIATYFDCPFGSGRLAIEQILRARAPGDFNLFVSHFEDWARAHYCTDVSLSCTDRHAAFARLYKRRGYALKESTFSKAL